MTATRYLQALLILYFKSAGGLRLSCEPGEEFKSHNLTCDTSRSRGPFTWSNGTSSISLCVSSLLPVCTTQRPFTGSYSASIVNNITTLTIVNVSRQTEGNYYCNDGDSRNASCDLRVYARPDNVSCQAPELQTNMSNVKVMCTVTRTYPNPVCQFSWSINGTSTNLTTDQTITYQDLPAQGQPGYFYKMCTLTQPVRNLGLGSHEFRVRAYPNVTGSASDITYGVDSVRTANVTISYPIVQLESCTQGYVLEGSTVNCSCRETANTFLPARTSFSHGSTVQSSGLAFTAYNFTASRNITGDLSCQATLLNWTSNPVIYRLPKVAYGPKNVTVNVYNLSASGDISLCDKSQPVEVTVTCTVSDDNVSPGADYQFIINGSRILENPAGLSSLTYRVATGGTIAFMCTGSNSAFKNLTATSPEQYLQVIEPTSAPPIIDTYQDSGSPVAATGGHMSVQEGATRIRCRAKGGYPSVSNVSVGCGPLTITSGGDVAFLDVNVTRSMDASECSCTATHSSPCYRNNKTVISLDVLFVPTVSFTVNEDTASVTVGRNSVLRLACEAEGNPSPALVLTKDGLQLKVYNSLLPQKFNLSLELNRTVISCVDAGVYSCQAQTGQAVANRSVDVKVRCQPQLENLDDQGKIYTGRVNNTIVITIPVIGYPEPSLYLDSDRDLNKDAYSLTYISQRPSYGAVSLTISTVTVTVFQSYRLIITNSEGALVYNFQIQEGPASPDRGVNVGAVVGGVVAGVVVVVAVVVIVVFLKRRGHLTKGAKRRNRDGHRQIISTDENIGARYANIPPGMPNNNGLSQSHYEEIREVNQDTQYMVVNNDVSQSQYLEPRDIPSQSQYVELRDVPSQYAELIDVPSQQQNVHSPTPGNSSDTCRGLNLPWQGVEYENTASVSNSRTSIIDSDIPIQAVEYENSLCF